MKKYSPMLIFESIAHLMGGGAMLFIILVLPIVV